MLQVPVVSEIGRLRVRELDRQAVFQRGADQVFRVEARAGVHEEDVVGQVPQARAPEESLHPEQPHLLKRNTFRRRLHTITQSARLVFS